MNEKEFVVKIIAPEIEPKLRHKKIFAAFDLLDSGQQLELTNDHDPKPLHAQFAMDRDGNYTWEYLEKGPNVWRVAIGKI